MKRFLKSVIVDGLKVIVTVAVINLALTHFGVSVRLTVESQSKSLVIVPDKSERLI